MAWDVPPYVTRDEPITISDGNMLELPEGSLAWTDTSVSAPLAALATRESDFVVWPGSMVSFMDDPLVVTRGILMDLTSANTVIWLDAARAPAVVSTLLVIGV